MDIKRTLRQELLATAEHYRQHAAWERKRAEQATNGSMVQAEIMQAAKYNEGRAAAMLEAVELLDRYIG